MLKTDVIKPSYDFFSGLGGSLQGMSKSKLQTKLGLQTTGIEIDPVIAGLARANGHVTIIQDILNMNKGLWDMLGNFGAFKLSFSPNCQPYSASNARLRAMLKEGVEVKEDMAQASTIVKIIAAAKPNYITIENVAKYENSLSMSIIREVLEKEGYEWTENVYNTHEYNVPQSRKRFIVIAVRGDMDTPIVPLKSDTMPSWYDCVSDQISDLKDWRLANWQLKILPEYMDNVHHIIDGTKGSYGTNITTRDQSQPMFTVVASQNRKPLKILLPNEGENIPVAERKVKRVSYDMLKQWQTFPRDYGLMGHAATDAKGIGNAVPCNFMQAICDAIYEDYISRVEK